MSSSHDDRIGSTDQPVGRRTGEDAAALDVSIGKGDTGDGHRRPDGPLDGSVSGTIGGGGRETGGSTARPEPPEMPPLRPDDAASGRLAPDPIGATSEPDELGPGPTDVSRQTD